MANSEQTLPVNGERKLFRLNVEENRKSLCLLFNAGWGHDVAIISGKLILDYYLDYIWERKISPDNTKKKFNNSVVKIQTPGLHTDDVKEWQMLVFRPGQRQ